MAGLSIYTSLFLVALTAATILPMQSEAVLIALFLANGQPARVLVAVAGVGNVFGSAINWLLSRGIERFRERQWCPVSEIVLARALSWYGQYGKWPLLLSWVPIIGDSLTVVAGTPWEPFVTFLVLVAIAKIGRYVLVTTVMLRVVGPFVTRPPCGAGKAHPDGTALRPTALALWRRP